MLARHGSQIQVKASDMSSGGFDHEEREMLETFIFQLKISFLFVCIQIFWGSMLICNMIKSRRRL